MKAKNTTRIVTFSLLSLTVLSALFILVITLLSRYIGSSQTHPQLLSDPSLARIDEIKTFPVVNDVQKFPCEQIESSVLESLATRNRVSLKIISVPDQTRDCAEYKVSEQLSILDLRLYGQKILLYKNLSPYAPDEKAKDWIYQKLLVQMLEYPGWNYEITSVAEDGTIYFRYGGWEYLGWERSGHKKFSITFLNQ